MPLKITALPLELLFCIASYLNLEDFVKFGKSKVLGEVLNDERINKEMVKVSCHTHYQNLPPLSLFPSQSPLTQVQ